MERPRDPNYDVNRFLVLQDTYMDPMFELVSLKQIGSVDQYHNFFVSLLNQIYLPEEYALSIFISNLKSDVSQYLRLLKPPTLVAGYLLAK